jgi:predicted nuclease of predicted toxin-antitoxin system
VTIVADESVDRQIVDRLRAFGHDIRSIAELEPGIDDEEVLQMSRESNAVLLTADKDFGELVFRNRQIHSGILLIRLAGLGTRYQGRNGRSRFRTARKRATYEFCGSLEAVA